MTSPKRERPERMCIGCRERAPKADLIRLVSRSIDGQERSDSQPLRRAVSIDPPQTAAGRGAYLHHDFGCVQLAVRRRALGRALRVASFDGPGLAEVLAPLIARHAAAGE